VQRADTAAEASCRSFTNGTGGGEGIGGDSRGWDAGHWASCIACTSCIIAAACGCGRAAQTQRLLGPGWGRRRQARVCFLGVLGLILHADRRAELGLKLLYYLPRTRASTHRRRRCMLGCQLQGQESGVRYFARRGHYWHLATQSFSALAGRGHEKR
jgi:hypothetical protein